jgi:hypothetical protein
MKNAGRLAALIAIDWCFAGSSFAQWNSYAQDPQHTALTGTPSQSLRRIHWQTPVDLQPLYSDGDLLIHYGSPLVTAANTVIVPVKTAATQDIRAPARTGSHPAFLPITTRSLAGFRVEARLGTNGSLIWRQTTDYILPAHKRTPVFGPVLTSAPRLYFPGAGGTVYYRDSPDTSTGDQGQFAFYGLSQYEAGLRTRRAFQQSVQINTPLTADSSGNIYFGFVVVRNNLVWPLYDSSGRQLISGIARISADGQGTWTSVFTASADLAMTQVVDNCAPAISNDGGMVYVGVSDGIFGYLIALNSTTLAPIARVRLKDPKSNRDALLPDQATASPTVGPDGDVYYGVLENPCCNENHERGWLLHFNSALTQSKIPGAFGWDDTASVVPLSMVPSYTGRSPYLLFTKYNNYAEAGGDNLNRIAILDPNNAQPDAVSGVSVMKEVMTMLGPTPVDDGPGVKEWCINSAVVDPATRSVLANSEDGNVYRWDLAANRLSEKVALTAGVGEAYTPTVIGPDGTVFAINNAILFAVGQ